MLSSLNEKKGPTKEERIKARRARLESRLKKQNDAKSGAGGAGADDQAKSAQLKSKRQITESRAKLDAATEQAQALVTDIKVERDKIEAERRLKAAEQRDNRLRALEAEMLESTKANIAIDAKWAVVAAHNEPRAIYDGISAQFAAAEQLLNSKKQIIAELQAELRTREAEYTELVEVQHKEDVELMVRRMKEQFKFLLTCSEEELLQIEKVFVSERKELIDKNKKEIFDMYERRRKNEEETMRKRAEREEENQQTLLREQSEAQDKYDARKRSLEHSVQQLEQCLQDMNATFELNREKLEINFQILNMRKDENKQSVLAFRIRIRRLRQLLTQAAARFNKQNARFQAENQQLSEDYKRITDNFKDLQRKFAHFEAADHSKYREVWAMNEDGVMKVVRKVLKADQLIREQVLGLQYVPPKTADGQVIDIDTVTSDVLVRGTDADVKRDTSLNTRALMSGGGAAGSGDAAAAGAAGDAGKFSNAQIKKVLDLLAVHGGFLVDHRVKESVDGLAADEAKMFRVDTILSALGVEDRDDLERLVALFYEHPSAPEVTLHANDIIKTLRNFVVKRQTQKGKPRGVAGDDEGPAVSAATAAAAAAAGTSIMKAAISSEKAARRREKEKKFWNALGAVIDEPTGRVWTALDTGLRKYNALLEERSKLIEQTTDLAAQNEELKRLLQEYLSSKINTELAIPPTRLIRVDQS